MDREEDGRSVTRLQHAITRLDALWEMPQMTHRNTGAGGPTWLPFMEGAMELLPGLPRIGLTSLVGLAITTRCRLRRKPAPTWRGGKYRGAHIERSLSNSRGWSRIS